LSEPLISGKVERSLRSIGLTEYESLAYLTLVKCGELTAGKLSKLTSIPYSKVYSILDNLERKGWIEIKRGRPRLYYPKSPVEALMAEQLKVENKFEQIKEIMVEELLPLYENREVKEKPEIWIIRGSKNIASNLRDILTKVKRELMVALPDLQIEIPPIVFPYLELLRDKKVNILILTSKDLINNLKDYLPYIAEIRIREEMFGGGVVVDGKETLLFLGKGVAEEQHLAIWSDHIGLNMIAKIYFQHLWDTAKPYINL
jgi:sugar-specific transcriptional regulator TrmB